MAKATLPTISIDDLKTEATKTFYAGAGVVDLAVEAVLEYVSDVQAKLVELQKDATTRLEGVQKSVKDFDFEPKNLRTQVETVVTARVEALTDEAKTRRAAIEKRVAELQAEAANLPTTVRKQLDETTTTATAAYADLAKRGEVLVGRIRAGEITKPAAKPAAKKPAAKPAAKKAAPAKKAAAKKAPAKKAAAKKAPAKKAAPASAPATA